MTNCCRRRRLLLIRFAARPRPCHRHRPIQAPAMCMGRRLLRLDNVPLPANHFHLHFDAVQFRGHRLRRAGMRYGIQLLLSLLLYTYCDESERTCITELYTGRV